MADFLLAVVMRQDPIEVRDASAGHPRLSMAPGDQWLDVLVLRDVGEEGQRVEKITVKLDPSHQMEVQAREVTDADLATAAASAVDLPKAIQRHGGSMALPEEER